jgi:hypothetical protein
MDQYFANLVRQEYNGTENLVWWNNEATAYNEAGWVNPGWLPIYRGGGFGNTIRYARGVYTSDLIYKKDNQIPAHAYLCLDAKDPERSREGFYLPPSLEEIASGWGVKVSGDILTEPDYSTSGSPGTSTHSVTRTANIITEGDCTVEYDYPVAVKAQESDIKSGFYELRLSAGFASTFMFGEASLDAWTDVSCEVTIQVGEKVQTYTVTLSAANDYNRGDGLFNIDDWIEEGTPTTIDETWYPGCWLIDIKNQTIIHETRLDKLDRPWFT